MDTTIKQTHPRASGAGGTDAKHQAQQHVDLSDFRGFSLYFPPANLFAEVTAHNAEQVTCTKSWH